MEQHQKQQIQEILQSIPEEFQVIESKIKKERVDEFYAFQEALSNQVDNTKTEPTKVKLSKLAETADVPSYRKIEEIIRNTEDEALKGFAVVALMVARVRLESELMDSPMGFIASGLGGKGNKLRYYFAVTSSSEIDADKESTIVAEIREICERTDSEFEEIENFKDYVLIRILVSFDYAIGHVIEELTNSVNFLDNDYFCVNTEKPSDEWIRSWMNGELDEDEHYTKR